MALRFLKKAVVVTGGSQGIGAAIVAAFYREGAAVTVLDVAGSDVFERSLLALPPSKLGNPLPALIPCDVSSKPAVDAAISAVGKAAAGLDVLVNNAAAFRFSRCEDATDEDWERVLGVNVRGYSNTMAAALPFLRPRRGAIVNVASVSAFIPQAGFVPYSTSKGAQVHLT